MLIKKKSNIYVCKLFISKRRIKTLMYGISKDACDRIILINNIYVNVLQYKSFYKHIRLKSIFRDDQEKNTTIKVCLHIWHH